MNHVEQFLRLPAISMAHLRRRAVQRMAAAASVVWLAASTHATAQGAASPAPGGAYIGYYQENPATNPEDPVPGAIYLRLPPGDDAFSGEMFFTYIGCQSSNVGSVSGRKAGASLSGSWSGTVDDRPQRGTFTGSYDAANGFYSGTYTNAGGKQHRDLNPCIEYFIAPDGAWALFPVERNIPAGFEIRVTGNAVRWLRQAGAEGSLVTIFDAALLAAPQGNAIVWQTVLEADDHMTSLSDVRLVRGKEYVMSVVVLGDTAQRLAVGSRRFVAN
jgi:hypothetical protein